MSKVMSVGFLCAVACGLGLARPAIAGLKTGKVTTTLTNPANVAGPFTNGTSKGTFSFKGTKATIKAKNTSVADTDGAHCTGDEVICLVTVRVTVDGGVEGELVIALQGEATDGKVTASHDLCKNRDSDVDKTTYLFCPDAFGPITPIAVSSVNAVCYAPEPGWTAMHTPDLPMSFAGHTCEGFFGSPPTPPSTVLFASGSTVIVP